MVDDREEVIVTRAGHEPVVIVALDEYRLIYRVAEDEVRVVSCRYRYGR